MSPFNPNGAIVYRGPSLLDGQPIVVILTGLAVRSANAKTGDMLQTWILREDVHPFTAIRTGEDVSICGTCPHRPAKGGACYVQVGRAPSNIWKAFKAGRYSVPLSLAALGAGRMVRLGSYGDPAAAPVALWDVLTSRALGWTGYTHQWRTAPWLQLLCMASVDTEAEGVEARAADWRTFRVRTPGEVVDKSLEFVCPASEEAGRKTDCEACKACMGGSAKAKASPVIIAHGATKRRFELGRTVAA